MSSIPQALIEMVDRARADYIMHYRRLRNVIDDRDIADELIHRSEEVGIDDALTRMRENPSALGLARNSPLLSLQTQRALAHILDGVLASQMRHGEAVKRREEYAQKLDPGRLPVHVINGREVSIDYANNKVVYMDDKTVVALDAVKKRTTKERRRGRGR